MPPLEYIFQVFLGIFEIFLTFLAPIVVTILVFFDTRRLNTLGLKVNQIFSSLSVFLLSIIFPVIFLAPIFDNYLIKTILSSFGAGLIYFIFSRIFKEIKKRSKRNIEIEKKLPVKNKSIFGLILIILIPIGLIIIWFSFAFRNGF